MSWPLHPSHASQWVPCPAFPRMQEHGVARPSQTAAEGNAAHWLASMVLTGQVGDVSELVDRRDPDDYAITGDLADYTSVYVNHVKAQPWPKQVEQNHNSGLPNVTETRPDVWWYDPTTFTLDIVDFKFGWRTVEAIENVQMLIGAWSAFLTMSHTPPLRYRLTIVQPRPAHTQGQIRTWTLTHEELKHRLGLLIDGPIARTQDPNAPTVAGEEQCRYCAALHVCPAARAAGLTLLDITSAAVPEMLNSAALRSEQKALGRSVEIAKLRIAAIEDHLVDCIRNGEIIEGIEIQQGQGHRKFKPGLTPEQLKIAGDMHGVKLLETKTIKPAAALKAGLPESALNVLTTRPSLAPKIVDVDLTQKAQGAFK